MSMRATPLHHRRLEGQGHGPPVFSHNPFSVLDPIPNVEVSPPKSRTESWPKKNAKTTKVNATDEWQTTTEARIKNTKATVVNSKDEESEDVKPVGLTFTELEATETEVTDVEAPTTQQTDDKCILSELPGELQNMIFQYLDDYSRLCLGATSRYFHRVVDLTREEKEEKARWISTLGRWYFACSMCFQWKEWTQFGKAQINNKRGRGRSQAKKRFCIACGLEWKLYSSGNVVDAYFNGEFNGVSFKDSSGWEPMLYGLDYFAWFKDSFGDPFGQGDGTLG
ncbi:hypothetical protein HDK64DRAFT_266717 [Phyllosticta capitalensis]